MSAGTAVRTPGVGETYRTHDVGGAKHPVEKIAWGDNTVANDVTAAAPLPVSPMLFNGTDYDIERANRQESVLATAARTATTTSAILKNYNSRGILVVVTITSAGTGNLTLSLVGENTLWTGATFTATRNVLFYPGVTSLTSVGGIATTGLNEALGIPVPRSFALRINHSDASSWTYMVTADYLTR